MIWKNETPSATDAFRAARLLWGIDKADLLSNRRDERIVRQRWIVFGLLNGRGFSHNQIAEVFSLHPSTITYGLHQHINATDEEYLENSDALVSMHDKLIHGYDPSPKTSDGSYKDYPRDHYGRQDCPHMGGFSDYNKETHTFDK